MSKGKWSFHCLFSLRITKTTCQFVPNDKIISSGEIERISFPIKIIIVLFKRKHLLSRSERKVGGGCSVKHFRNLSKRTTVCLGDENEDKKRVVPTCQKRFNLYIPRGGLVPAAAASPFNRPHIIIWIDDDYFIYTIMLLCRLRKTMAPSEDETGPARSI